MGKAEDLRYSSGYGLVTQSYDTWEVDIEAIEGGRVSRAEVIGPRLPEVSTADRPQWVYFEFSENEIGKAFCWPVASRLPGGRADRKTFVYYDEVGNFRSTIDRGNEAELRLQPDPANETDLLRVRIRENEREIVVDTPKTRITLADEGGDITIDADQAITLQCTNATVVASDKVAVTAGGDIDLNSAATVRIAAAQVEIN